ncbi:MAG: histidine kinase, partial [Myxococcaceae bacterium]|nr:histidine kinase [Myxococcaceae bacterium]
DARTRALEESNQVLKASLERQREIHEQLLQTAKLAAVGQLAAGLAHEINNPLGVIIGFGQALQRRLPEGSPLAMPVASILREGQRCRDMVTEMLTFSRRSKPVMEPVDLNALVTATTVLLETRACQQRVVLKQALAPQLPPVSANKNQLQQVLVNLSTNALDAMPQGGTLTLSTRRLDDGRLSLQVADTGSGMPPDVRAHIFEPFFTTKELGKGTGLGLSLVYEIVTQHGGRIDVESAEGRGTVMAVQLPAPAPAPLTGRPALQ